MNATINCNFLLTYTHNTRRVFSVIMDNEHVKQQFNCSQCNATFNSRSKKEIHIDRIHKQSKTIKYPGGIVRTVIRNEEGQVECVCGRSYDYFKSLERHAREGCYSVKEQELEANKENQMVNGNEMKLDNMANC